MDDLLRAARIPLRPGMATEYGFRMLAVHDDGTVTTDELATVGDIPSLSREEHVTEPEEDAGLPDPSDRATWWLMLEELASRVPGMEPARGLTWSPRYHDGAPVGWVLEDGFGFGVLFVPDPPDEHQVFWVPVIGTEDGTEAMLRALGVLRGR